MQVCMHTCYSNYSSSPLRSQAGLAYQKEAYVNWDPIDQTVIFPGIYMHKRAHIHEYETFARYIILL